MYNPGQFQQNPPPGGQRPGGPPAPPGPPPPPGPPGQGNAQPPPAPGGMRFSPPGSAPIGNEFGPPPPAKPLGGGGFGPPPPAPPGGGGFAPPAAQGGGGFGPPPSALQGGGGFAPPPPAPQGGGGFGPPPPVPVGVGPVPPGGAQLNSSMGSMSLQNNSAMTNGSSMYQPPANDASGMRNPNGAKSPFMTPTQGAFPNSAPPGAVGGPRQGGAFPNSARPGVAGALHQQAPVGVHPPSVEPISVDSYEVDYTIKPPRRILGLSCSKIPATPALATSAKVPIGGILRPLAPPGPEDDEIDVIQPGAAGIVRCKKCRMYINPFSAWLENGRRWRCNMCSQVNETPSAYFCHLDPNTNRRSDVDLRPELSKSVVEYVAPSEYMVRAPQPPSYFFVIDVSARTANHGVLTSIASAIRTSLQDLPGGTRTNIGFITYDVAVHYYCLRAGSSNAQMMVVSDLNQLFVPSPEDLLTNLSDCKVAVDSFLDNLPTMFADNHSGVSSGGGGSCLGPALKAAYTVMKNVGGKMSVFQSAIPSLGDGALHPRENHRLMGTAEEVKLLKPSMNWYKDTAIELSKNQISVDMYLFPYQYIDCASLLDLPRITGGEMFTYVAFDEVRDGPKFRSNLQRRLVQSTAFEAVLRVRCTKGLKVSNFYGNFFIRGTDLLALPNCNTDSVFGFDMVHENQGSVGVQNITLQSALLYTTSDGERRIRVVTQAIPVSNLESEIIASVNAEMLSTLLSKQALVISLRSGLDAARTRLQKVCIDIIKVATGKNQRKVSGYTVPASGNADGEGGKIPENLELLPLYTLALLKNVAFRGGTDVHPDERMGAHMMLNNMSMGELIKFVHPRLFSIHNMGPGAGMSLESGVNKGLDGAENIDTVGRNQIVLPLSVNLSVERLGSDGLYVLDNGVDVYLWVGRAADEALIQSIFGVNSLDTLPDISRVTLTTSGNDLATRLDTIIQALREEKSDIPARAPKIVIIREGDVAAESRFFWNLIEDSAQFSGGTYTYAEFMEFVIGGGDEQSRPQGGPAGGPPGNISTAVSAGSSREAFPTGPPGQGSMHPRGPPGQGALPGAPGSGGMPPQGYGGVPPPGPPGSGGMPPQGYGGVPPPGPPRSGGMPPQGYGSVPPPGPPRSGGIPPQGYRSVPPPGPPGSGGMPPQGYGGVPPPGPPGAGGMPPPGPQRSYNMPQPGPPSQGNMNHPDPPGQGGMLPPGPPGQGSIPQPGSTKMGGMPPHTRMDGMHPPQPMAPPGNMPPFRHGPPGRPTPPGPPQPMPPPQNNTYNPY